MTFLEDSDRTVISLENTVEKNQIDGSGLDGNSCEIFQKMRRQTRPTDESLGSRRAILERRGRDAVLGQLGFDPAVTGADRDDAGGNPGPLMDKENPIA